MKPFQSGMWIGTVVTAVVLFVIPMVVHSGSKLLLFMPDDYITDFVPSFTGSSPCPVSFPGYERRDPGLPNGSQCRHACGPNCVIPNDCTNLEAWQSPTRCVNSTSGFTHWYCTYAIVRCGTNDGCRNHDDCYDTCDPSLLGAACRRACDQQCIAQYSSGQCYDWMGGNNYQSGPNAQLIDFTYPPTAGPILPGSCS